MTLSPAPSLLLIDAGNTRVKAGTCAWPDLRASDLPQFAACAAVPCGMALPWDELGRCARQHARVVAAITGSNPPEVERIVREWPADWPEPRVIKDRRTFPLTIDVDFPDKVGIDRLLGAIAANVVRRPGQPAIIISSGTATTVDYVNEQGHFCGGAIMPGFELCAKALHQYTALLPLIPIDEVLAAGGPPVEIGRNTQAAMTSGLYWGHVGAVRELLHRLTAAPSGNPTSHASEQSEVAPLVLLTGGAAPLLQPHLPSHLRFEPHLALQGLALVVAQQPAQKT